MGGEAPPYVPSMLTTALENFLRNDAHCTKRTCTDRICIRKTPKGNGFMVPNPLNEPTVPVWVLAELREKIRQLDTTDASSGETDI
jgi:hypothetical protein